MAISAAEVSLLPSAEDMQRYADCMEEIKRRVDVIECFLSGKCQAMYLGTTTESICLQLRVVLELIAMSSLVANKSAYEKAHGDFRSRWKAKQILKEIENLNPHFYPQPTSQVVDPAMGKVTETIPVEGGYLTRQDFEHLYDSVSDFLHAENPYAVGAGCDSRSFLDEVPKWMSRIWALLNHHQVQLIDTTHQLWVLMTAEEDGNVHVSLFQNLGTWSEALDYALNGSNDEWRNFVELAHPSPHFQPDEDADDVTWAQEYTRLEAEDQLPELIEAVDPANDSSDPDHDLFSRLDVEFPEHHRMHMDSKLPTPAGQAFVRRLKAELPEALYLFVPPLADVE